MAPTSRPPDTPGTPRTRQVSARRQLIAAVQDAATPDAVRAALDAHARVREPWKIVAEHTRVVDPSLLDACLAHPACLGLLAANPHVSVADLGRLVSWAFADERHLTADLAVLTMLYQCARRGAITWGSTVAARCLVLARHPEQPNTFNHQRFIGTAVLGGVTGIPSDVRAELAVLALPHAPLAAHYCRGLPWGTLRPTWQAILRETSLRTAGDVLKDWAPGDIAALTVDDLRPLFEAPALETRLMAMDALAQLPATEEARVSALLARVHPTTSARTGRRR